MALLHHDHRLADRGKLPQHRLDLSQFEADAAELDLVTSCVVVEAEPAKIDATRKLTKNQATMLGLLDDFGPGGATVEDWNAAARQEGLGVKRKADLSDFRRGLKDKRLVHTTSDRWYVTRL